jgi:hypothetical protein
MAIDEQRALVERGQTQNGEAPADRQGMIVEMPRERIVASRLVEIKVTQNELFVEGGLLLREAFQGDYARLLGYTTFEDFVEVTLHVSYRTAKYWMDITEVFVEKINVDRQLLINVGWGRAKELLPIVKPENADAWLNFAKDHTTTEIHNAVKEALGQPVETTEDYSTMSVGVFDDEKKVILEAIELAARETGNERKGYNLARICEDYASEARARQEQALAQGQQAEPIEVVAGAPTEEE